MNDELLYEVDEQDRVIGSRTRGELHRLRLRHRAVHILVFNPDDELFLQQRSLAKDINPGLWDTSAAGHVDFGESYEDCAKRELREELGIVATAALEHLFKLPASEQTGWEFVQVYRIEHAGELLLNTDEISGGRWFPKDRVHFWVDSGGQDLTSSFRTLWQTYRTRQ